MQRSYRIEINHFKGGFTVGEQINFSDIISGDFLETELFGSVDIINTFLGLAVTFVLAMFIFFIYKKTFSGIIYSHNFNVSLVLMSLITSVIIMTISSNLVLSLGMVGALSIVRFRTAVKDPMDIVFMFWAIALGVTTGAKLYFIAIVGSLFIGIVAIILLRFKNTNNIFMLVIHYEEEAQDSLLRILSRIDYKMRSKTISRNVIELTVELKLVGINTNFVENISDIEGVKNVSLVSYNGNFVG